MISNGGLDRILAFQNQTTSIGDVNVMVGVMLLITTIGGDTFTLMITSINEKTSQITCIGDEELGETSIGGGIARPGNSMILNTNLPKETLDGGTVFLIIKIFLLITWTCLLLGFDIMKTSQAFGDVTELLLIG